MITRPLLAATLEDLNQLNFPVLATPKLDGIRALMVNSQLVSRTFKPIPNQYIRNKLESLLKEGMDGEIMLRDSNNFNEIQSAVMSRDGCPDFIFHIFDWVRTSQFTPYSERVAELVREFPLFTKPINVVRTSQQYRDAENTLTVLTPIEIANIDELHSFENYCITAGYEGVMLRSPHGIYKHGRSTVREGILLKLKRFRDSEAMIIGFEEKEINLNEQEVNAFGLAKRSFRKEGKLGADTLGNLLVRDVQSGVEFSIGSGLNDAIRQDVWSERDKYLGKIVTYKYFPVGVKEKPRHPVFKGFRHEDDI